MTPAKHVRGVEDLGKDGILEILELSNHFLEVSNRRIPKVPALRGNTVANLFFETPQLLGKQLTSLISFY